MECIWKGDVGNFVDASELLILVDQIHEYAVTTHRDFVIRHLKPWLLHSKRVTAKKEKQAKLSIAKKDTQIDQMTRDESDSSSEDEWWWRNNMPEWERLKDEASTNKRQLRRAPIEKKRELTRTSIPLTASNTANNNKKRKTLDMRRSPISLTSIKKSKEKNKKKKKIYN